MNDVNGKLAWLGPPVGRLVLCGAVAVTWLPATGAAAGAESRWITGAELQQQLREPFDITWTANPLRAALTRLSEVKQLALLLDRRIDPGQELDLSVQSMPLQTAIEGIAEKCGMGVSLLGPVAYFGPKEAVARLRTVAALQADTLRTFPPEVQEKYFKKQALRWDDFATPRGLLEELAAANQLQLYGLELIPHDLWAGADLPPLSLVERLTLILNQFDLSFQASPDGQWLKVIPLPNDLGVVRSYPGGFNAEAVARRYAAIAPDAKIKVVDGTIWVKALLEDHERIHAGGSPATASRPEPRPATPNFETTRFTIKVENRPLGDLVYALTQKLQLQLKWDETAIRNAGIDLGKLVSFEVKEGTVDELFESLLEGSGLQARRNAAAIEIVPK